EELLIVCKDCIALEHQDDEEEANIAEANNREYGCSHVAPEFRYKYWFGVFDRDDVDNYPDWHTWGLTFIDAKKHAAERDAEELEREIRDGVVNLSRLKGGDVIRVSAKRLTNSEAIWSPP